MPIDPADFLSTLRSSSALSTASSRPATHLFVLGKVQAMTAGSSTSPLVFHNGCYARIVSRVAAAV